MTLDIKKQVCARCMKNGCSDMCYGCQQAFCSKHFMKHRLHLSQQMEDFNQKQELFHNQLEQNHFEHPFISNIYAWERKAMRQIQEIAENARTELQQWMNKIKNEVKVSLNEMKEQVLSSKNLDNYTELDLRKWTEQLSKLRNLLEKPTNISIIEDEKPSSYIRTIKVIDKQSTSHSSVTLNKAEFPSRTSLNSLQEHFVIMFGPCKLSEEAHVATHSSYRAGLSQITGINQYSSGKSSIRFLIDNKGTKNIFIGIMSSSHKIISPTFDYSVHGWWNLNHTIINGESKGDNSTEIFQKGDKITLIIDCDNQQIQLKHYRTKRLVHLPIKLEVCPFPWKILVRLLTTDDTIRILH